MNLLHKRPVMKRKFENNLNESATLHTAAQNGDSDLVKILLDNGAYINEFDKNQVTPIYFAARNGHPNVIKLLLAKNANYQNTGAPDTGGDLITPLEIASRHGHIEVVKLLLALPHTTYSLKKALHYSFDNALRSKDSEKRNCLVKISDLIKNELNKKPKQNVLSIQNGVRLTWPAAYKTLFNKNPSKADKTPNNEEAAIRNALVIMYQLLQDPEYFVPIVRFLSQELEYHWNQQNDLPFKKFNSKMIDIHTLEGMSWPIPNEKYQGIKKNHLISRVLLDKLKQYGMGDNQYKWTGFIPKNKSMELLSNNAFFTENRRTISGLFHGNVHNIQRVILLFAMESYDIPLSYISENGEEEDIGPKKIFAALMRKDIFPEERAGAILWPIFLDITDFDYSSFSHPHRMHSLLLTEKRYAGFLQDYLLYSFCEQFNHMRELHNHAYKTSYTNLELCKELEKIMFHVFGGIPEFAIQMDENKSLEKVDTIDDLKDKWRRWNNEEKHYLPLEEPVKNYSILDDEEIDELFCDM